MRCFVCWKEITEANRQTYREGFDGKVPYCRPCVQKYIAKQKLRAMSSQQRAEFLAQTKEQLKGKTYTPEERRDAMQQLKETGLKEKEIEELFKDL